jgi:hypothetical protein
MASMEETQQVVSRARPWEMCEGARLLAASMGRARR